MDKHMTSINELFVQHALKMKSQQHGSVMPGVFSDCHGTLFQGDDINPLLSAFLRAAKPIWGMTPHVISSYLPPYIPTLKATGISRIAGVLDKQSLNTMLLDRNQKLEFLIDDEPMMFMDAVTVIHPRQFIPMLGTLESTLLAPYIQKPMEKAAKAPRLALLFGG